MEKAQTVYYDLYRNGSPIFRAYRDSIIRRQKGGVILSGQLDLNKQDAVFLRIASGIAHPTYMSMFSGYLIK